MTYVLISVVKSKVYLIDRSSGLNVTLKNVGDIWEFCIHVTKDVASNERLALHGSVIMLRFSAKYRRSQSIEWLKVLVGQMLEKLAKQHFEASTDFQIRSAKNRSAMPSTQ